MTTPEPALDPDRTLALLWRHVVAVPGGSRGPGQRSSVDEVVAAAIAIADEDGLAALSMRRVADRLGLKVMSLYTYVAGKDELIVLMIDQVAGESVLAAHERDVRARLRRIAELLWDERRRHPWLPAAESGRPVLGPHLSDRYEWHLQAVDGLGLTDVEMDQVVSVLVDFSVGAAQTAYSREQVAEASGISEEQWWQVNAPILRALMPAQRYPLAQRVGAAVGEADSSGHTSTEPDGEEVAFRFGLGRLLDGLMLYLDRATRPDEDS